MVWSNFGFTTPYMRVKFRKYLYIIEPDDLGFTSKLIFDITIGIEKLEFLVNCLSVGLVTCRSWV
jgi:hypothetical protein